MMLAWERQHTVIWFKVVGFDLKSGASEAYYYFLIFFWTEQSFYISEQSFYISWQLFQNNNNNTYNKYSCNI